MLGTVFLLMLLVTGRAQEQGAPPTTTTALITPRENSQSGIDFITNEAYHFLKNLGDSYRIDLNNKGGFEEEFARVMTRGDKDSLLVTVQGTDHGNEIIFPQMKRAFESRFWNQTLLLKTDNLRDEYKTSEAGIWFFLSGVASTFKKSTTGVDVVIGKLQQLAQSSINGKPFYPKQVVIDLMEGSLSKMHDELSPLVRKLGYTIIEKGQLKQGEDITKDNLFIPAEFFQFWTELSVFVSTQLPPDNILITPLTLVHTSKVTITISNINVPKGGPLSQHQFQSIAGFLATKSMQLLSFNLNDATIKADFAHFFRGFCKAQLRDGNLKLFLGKRHVNTPIRANEFRFLAENFRQLQIQCLDNIAKFSRALDMHQLAYIPVVDAPDVNVINAYLNGEGNLQVSKKNALSRFEEEEEEEEDE